MKSDTKKINIGIGFVTGRKNFKNVVKTYLRNFTENGHLDPKKYAIHLFVAYDLKFTSTKVSDYTITDEVILDTVDSAYYLGPAAIKTEVESLIEQKIVTAKESRLIFGEGYAMKRNAVLYFAVKNKMDSLIFLDDDEYPVANIKSEHGIVWKGQEVLSMHIEQLKHADMTHGYHCGYISPIPHFRFNEHLSEDQFRIFIESISNDIINWTSIKEKMDDGGVTYAKPDIVNNGSVKIVKEINGMKFISGANLGFNLKDPDKLFPFYNPPGARGEDTFLSTCIGESVIHKIPCYTFHDGFSAYENLLNGVLPNAMKVMDANSASISKRFFKASIGWIRYKPLLLYITQRSGYELQMVQIKEKLTEVIPHICLYFGNNDFNLILKEYEFYHEHVEEHFRDFENTKKVWLKIMTSFHKSSTLYRKGTGKKI